MSLIPADLKLRYATTWKKDHEKGIIPDKYAAVVFAEPRETFTLATWAPDGPKDQEYVHVLNPDINQGRIRYPFEAEFEVVK